STVLLIQLEAGFCKSENRTPVTAVFSPLLAPFGQNRTGFDGETEEIRKFVLALGPRRFLAAESYAMAASSAESKVPSHTRVFFEGSLISAANRPQGLFLTPLNFIWTDPLLAALAASGKSATVAAAVVLPLGMVNLTPETRQLKFT
ncbi:hypothetical protein V2J09_001559, partial [Rumex salicifolius]